MSLFLLGLLIGFLVGAFSICLLLAFWERDTRQAGEVLD